MLTEEVEAGTITIVAMPIWRRKSYPSMGIALKVRLRGRMVTTTSDTESKQWINKTRT